MRIEHFFTIAAVEPFDVCVLVWFAGLYVIDPDTVLAAPFGKARPDRAFDCGNQ